MTILTPEVESTPEAEHGWKEDVSTGLSKVQTDVAQLRVDVDANTAILEEEEEDPLIEVESRTTTDTSIGSIFKTNYPVARIVCIFEIATVGASGLRYILRAGGSPGGSIFYKQYCEIVANSQTLTVSISADFVEGELPDGTVELYTFNGSGAVTTTVEKWKIIRFREVT